MGGRRRRLPILRVPACEETPHVHLVHHRNGDPARAAQALIAAVESPEPPGFLLLGRDALDTYRQTADAQLAEVRAWEKLTVSTGFTD